MKSRVVVVGAGHAGSQCAITLRQLGFEGDIVLLGDEPHLPYHRPPLSKKVLQGKESGERALSLRARELYDQLDVELILGEHVASVSNGVADAQSGRSWSYDRLVLATGSTSRSLSVPGTSLPGVFSLRSLTDARSLSLAIPSTQNAVVIGGGFIGLESCAALRAAGARVTVVESSSSILGRSLSTLMAERVAEIHRHEGVELMTGTTVAEFCGADRLNAVTTSDGRRIPADLAITAVGTAIDLGLAKELGLETSVGVLVDETNETSQRGVFAIGDLAEGPHPLHPERKVVMTSVANADAQAVAAARAIVGLPPEAHPVPWFWSDQYSAKLHMIGAPIRVEQSIIREHEDGLTHLQLADGILVGAECLNRPADAMAIRRAMGAGQVVPSADLTDADIRIRDAFSAD